MAGINPQTGVYDFNYNVEATPLTGLQQGNLVKGALAGVKDFGTQGLGTVSNTPIYQAAVPGSPFNASTIANTTNFNTGVADSINASSGLGGNLVGDVTAADAVSLPDTGGGLFGIEGLDGDTLGAVAGLGQLGLSIANFGDKQALQKEQLSTLKQNRALAEEDQAATRAYRRSYQV